MSPDVIGFVGGKFLEEFLLGARDLIWHGDLDCHEKVTRSAPLRGDPFAAHPEYLAGWRARWHFHRDTPVEGRHIDLGT